MTPPDRPENPFARAGIGEQYARGRPYHHPRALACALALLGETGAGRALDVACGTGLSMRALRDVAEVVIGIDRSSEMLGAASELAGSPVVLGTAEQLSFRDSSIDAVTVSSGVHWFDQTRFFAEVHRALRPGGWVALYDHFFVGEMCDVPEFAEWSRRASERYPLPPRNPQVGDPRAKVPDGFDAAGDEMYTDDVTMTHEQLVDYQLSMSSFVVARGSGASAPELRDWVTTTTAPFYDEVPERALRFLGSVTCLRRLP